MTLFEKFYMDNIFIFIFYNVIIYLYGRTVYMAVLESGENYLEAILMLSKKKDEQ